MPSSTFFNLPEEKRNKFLQAARAEFSRVPFTEVSINRIIRDAGIPRGSFYMYFKDKRELLLYLLGEYGGRMIEHMVSILRQENGDPFAAFLALYDAVRLEYEHPNEGEDAFVPLTSILRMAGGEHTDLLDSSVRPKVLLAHLRPHIDTSLLSLQTEQDLEDILTVLANLTGSVLFHSFRDPNPEAVRTRYLNLLSIVKRGMAAQSKQ